jgi:glycosyltransferase involved in cell wall biosynthesis
VLRRRYPVYEYHRQNRYVINSNYTADLFLQAHGDLLPVVYPPVDTSRFHFTPGDLPARDTLTFFSRIVDYKRPQMLLELARQHREYRCVIMGGVPVHRRDYFNALQAQARQMGLDQVEFIANPDDAQVRAVLARTRFYIFPARNEHFGMTTVEAIAAGCIPFVHDSGGQREIVPDPRLRFDAEDFNQRFRALAGLEDSALRAIRRDLVEHIQQFSEESFNRKMLAFLHHSLSDRSEP